MQLTDALIFSLSRKNIQLLDYMIQSNGIVTEDGQSVYYAALSFYINSKKLARMGLIECIGRTENSNQKRWLITPKGRQVVNHVKAIDKLLDEGDVVVL